MAVVPPCLFLYSVTQDTEKNRPRCRSIPGKPAESLRDNRLQSRQRHAAARAQIAGTLTPIMSPSRTIPASLASSHPSVPAGRIGSTIQR